jgi:hypothetical protein
VLTTVKVWPGSSVVLEAVERRPTLTAFARDVVQAAGRDEETALRSNQETD